MEQLKSEGLDVDGMVSAKESSSYDVIHIIIMTLKIIIIIVATTILTRFAMLGSRLTGALCWSQQSKGNDLMLVSVLHVKNLNEGGEVWTYWCPMQQSTPTLDPSLAALKRFHGGRILGNNVTFSRLGTRSSKST